MELKNDHSIVNLQFMKITGFYQLLISSSHSLKLFNINIYKIVFIVQISILFAATMVGFYSIYSCMNDVNQMIHYIIIIYATYLAIFKYYFIIKNLKTIWDCMRMISINFLSHDHHTKEIFKIARKRSSTIIFISLSLWSCVVLYWSLSAIFSHNSFIKIKFKDGVYKYRSSALGFIFPISDTFYNKYFTVFYTFESLVLIMWGHMMWGFDILMISVCISIKYQLKTIAESYSLLGHQHNHLTRELFISKYYRLHISKLNIHKKTLVNVFYLNLYLDNNKSTKHVEDNILDLEILIQDQQNVIV